MIVHFIYLYSSNWYRLRKASPLSANAGSLSASAAATPSPIAKPAPGSIVYPVANYIRASTSLAIFSYTSTTTSGVRYLQCIDVGDRYRLVYTEPAIDCNSSDYASWLPFVIFLLLLLDSHYFHYYFCAIVDKGYQQQSSHCDAIDQRYIGSIVTSNIVWCIRCWFVHSPQLAICIMYILIFSVISNPCSHSSLLNKFIE
jgi:hypothetical protein